MSRYVAATWAFDVLVYIFPPCVCLFVRFVLYFDMIGTRTLWSNFRAVNVQLIVTLAKANPEVLSGFFKKYARTVLSGGGTLRGVMNHGVRELPERWRR